MKFWLLPLIERDHQKKKKNSDDVKNAVKWNYSNVITF